MRDEFPEFVRLRRRWFAILFVVTFVVGLFVMGQRYHSAIEIVGLALIVALASTTLLSLLSVPVLFFLARRQAGKKTQKP